MPIATAKLLSIYDIGEALGYSPPGIFKAIERHGIKPDQVTASEQCYYSENVLQILRDKMRRKTGTPSEIPENAANNFADAQIYRDS